ncbi:cellulose synthase [Microtetraspora sp. AC03309]|uniref:cellulose synthase n=1 Tax=Microtetraspora sp. AC03309 TaxID=2779376 RepID=UPI001E38EDA4|nr:cellulose synthase [Microtetraspora sp. AC03309]MCC5578625.1 cellulose synthase [Microtetraspora sp. AC03309]
MSFDQIAWMPLCAALTAVGIVLSYLAFRRRGLAAGLRATAWALLPLAAYLTGALKTLWNVISSLVSFVTGLVLSPMVWTGIVLAGLSALLFVVSGALRGRALARDRTGTGGENASAPTPTGTPAAAPGGKTTPIERPAKPAPADDFSDIEDILKRRGIS